jgi:hypothetical protein
MDGLRAAWHELGSSDIEARVGACHDRGTRACGEPSGTGWNFAFREATAIK